MKELELKELNNDLFDLQYKYNGLYGYFITYRFVTTNQYFEVNVFHHSNREKTVKIRNQADLKNLKQNTFDL